MDDKINDVQINLHIIINYIVDGSVYIPVIRNHSGPFDKQHMIFEMGVAFMMVHWH